MKTLGNIVWLIFGGIATALLYFVAGLLACVTVIGIPFGLQFFKLGTYALMPFGYEMVGRDGEPTPLSTLFNVLWIIFGWWEIALLHILFGVVLCITIIGIPLGMAHFKIAFAAVFPFGREIRKTE